MLIVFRRYNLVRQTVPHKSGFIIKCLQSANGLAVAHFLMDHQSLVGVAKVY